MAGIGHRGFFGRRKGVTPCSLDTDAFVTATGISGTNETALRALAAGLEADGLCEKIVAFYPIIGGTASAHSYNLKDTSKYQVTWSGTVTHDANGCKSDGTTGWGDTGCYVRVDNPDFAEIDDTLGIDGCGISGYSKEIYAASAAKCMMGTYDGNRTYIHPLVNANSGGIAYITCQNSNNPNRTGVGNSQGFFTITNQRVHSPFSSLPRGVYKDGALLISETSAARQPDSTIGLLCRKLPSPTDFFNQYATNFVIHKYLDDTQAANLYARIQTFETAIGR